MDYIAVIVSDDLDFNMSWLLDQSFEEYPVITESLSSFGLASLKRFHYFFLLPYNSHSSSSTAECGFHHDRQSIFSAPFYRLFL